VLTVTSEFFDRFRREPEGARAHAQEALAISEENGFTYWLHRARVSHGWALTELGQLDEGIAEMDSGLATLHELGGFSYQHYANALLAHAYARIGHAGKGLVMLDEQRIVGDFPRQCVLEAVFNRPDCWLLVNKFAELQIRKHLLQMIV
jgi:hypothetical protein